MPGSSPRGKDAIISWIQKQNIKVIVDVGPGEATYPRLLGKEYTWIGVEIWEPYVEKYHLYDYYSRIIVGDITKIELPDADCIIFGDVLEHLEKEQAIDLMKQADKKYMHVIISIPIGIFEQGEIFGNKYETHLSTWELKELIDILGSGYQWTLFGPDNIGVFLK